MSKTKTKTKTSLESMSPNRMLLSCPFLVCGKGTIKGGGKSLEKDTDDRETCCLHHLTLFYCLAFLPQDSVCSSASWLKQASVWGGCETDRYPLFLRGFGMRASEPSAESPLMMSSTRADASRVGLHCMAPLLYQTAAPCIFLRVRVKRERRSVQHKVQPRWRARWWRPL